MILNAKQVIDTLASTETQGDTLGDVDVAALHNGRDNILVEVKINTLGDTLGDVACEALVETLAEIVA